MGATQFKINKKSPIDFILAGLAGAGRGAVAGVTQKTEQDRQEKIRQALEDFRNRQLFLQERAQMQDVGQNIMDRLLKKSAAEKAAEAKIKAATIEFGRKTELQELKGEQAISEIEKTAELKPGQSFLDKLLDRTVKMVGVQNVQSQMASRDLRDLNDTARVTLAQKQFDLDSNMKQIDTALKIAEIEYKPSVSRWMAEERIAIDRNWGGMSDDEKQYTSIGLWLLSAAIESDNEEMYSLAQDFVKGQEKMWKRKGYPFPKIDFEMRRKRVLGVPIPFTKEPVLDITEPEPTGVPGAAPTREEQPSIFDTSQGANLQSLLDGIGLEPGAVSPIADPDDILEQLGPPPVSEAYSVQDVNTAVRNLRSTGITILTDETKDEMKKEGLSQEQIDYIEEAIAAE